MMWPWKKREPLSLEEHVHAVVEANKALDKRDEAVRHALGRKIIADIECLAYMPNWNTGERMVAAGQRAAIKNLVAMDSGLPPVDLPPDVGIQR